VNRFVNAEDTQLPTDRLEVEIDELILHDSSGVDGSRIAEAVERELASQFQAKGNPPTMTENLEIASLRTEVKQSLPASDTRMMAEHLGSAVFGVLGK
jgi:hypothetical protein